MSSLQYVPLNSVLLPPISGRRPAGGVSSNTDGIPSIGGENILSIGGMTYEELKCIPYSFFKLMPKGRLLRNDVLINKDGAQTGKVGFYGGDFEEAAVNEHVFILRARSPSHLDQRYLYYCVLLRETRNKVERRITGSAQPGLNSQFVKAVDIPLPPLPKQQKIAAILSSIDTAIERTEALIGKYRQIKTGLMRDLLTRGVLPNGQLRPPREQSPELYQKTAIGWTPKEWATEKLENLTSQIVDGVHHTPRYVEHGVPFVTVKNLTASESIDFSDLNYISREDHEIFKRRAFPQSGDVLVTKDGTLGVARVVKNGHPEFSIFVSVALLRPIRSKIDAEWLFVFFDTGTYESQLGHLSAGTGLKHIHLEHFRKFTLPLPCLEEQLMICNRIEMATRAIRAELCKSEKLRRQKEGLMHDLLTGKVPVKIEDPEVVDG